MPDIFPLEGLKDVFQELADSGAIPAYWHVRLFKNNVSIGASTVIGDFTEADFSGYANVVAGSPVVDTDGAGRGRLTCAAVTFTCTGASPSNDIYGYYVTNSHTNKLVWAQAWPSAPVTINTAGQFLTVVPRLTDKSEV